MRLVLADRLIRRQETHSYRQILSAALAADSALRSLPALHTLPHFGMREDGTVVKIDIPSVRQGMLLRGTSGSGRRLVIAQLAHAWLAGGIFEKPLPLPIDLARLDDGVASPNALLTALVAGLDRGKLGGAVSWLLLMSGLEDLPPIRRSIWRSALVGHMYPHAIQLGIVVAPVDEPPWPGLTTVTLPPTGPHDAQRWLSHLLPDLADRKQTALLGVLGPMPTLFDCALAALLSTNGQVPGSRIDRERRALALFRAQRPGTGTAPAAIGSGMASFMAQRMALLWQATQIVEHGSYELVLEQPLCADLVLLTAGLATESDQLLKVLARHAAPDTQILLLAGRCLAEHPPRSAALTLLIVRALGQLISTGFTNSEQAGLVLAACLPALDAALSEAVRRNAERVIHAVLSALPIEYALPRLVRLAYDAATPEPIGWRCAMRLAGLPSVPQVAAPEAPHSLARWAFVQALGGSTGHARLLQHSSQALRALATAASIYREPAALALLAHPELPVPVRLAALRLIEPTVQSAGAALLPHLARDPVRAMRMAALARLTEQSNQYGGRVAAQIAGDVSQPWEIRADALQFVARAPVRMAGPVLIACATDPALPLHVRIEALRSRRMLRNPQPALLAITRNQQHDPIIRAAALRLIATRPSNTSGQHRPLHRDRLRRVSYRFAHTLAWLLEDPTTPLHVALVACELLAARGGSLAAVTLIGVIERAPTNNERTYATIVALGRLRGERVVHMLATLLGAGALTRLQQGYSAALTRLPTAQALVSNDVPLTIRHSLQIADQLSLRIADRPTTLYEYLLTAADRLRTAAAQALAQIGGIGARMALVDALIAGESATATPALLDALMHVCGPDDAQPLAQIIRDPNTTARVRWLVVQRLADHPAALRLLLEYVHDASLDTLSRATLAAALGRRKVAGVLPPLTTIAQDRSTDGFLREQALIGLGSVGNAASDAILLRIAADPTELPRLRGVAAAQIRPTMDAATHWALRNLVHHERATVDVLVGGLVALGQARDREALPLLMQYSLDQRSEVARAAIDALAAVNDSTITSVLVGLSQKVHLDRVLRLHAIGALLRMGDPDGPLLIRDYLHGSSVPLQLQALEQIIAAGAPVAQLLALASDKNRAVAFRLRALDGIATLDSAEPLAMLVEDMYEPAEVRGQAIQILVAVGGTKAHELLLRIAGRTEDHAGVRSYCIDALVQRRDPAAAPILAQIAVAADNPLICERAALALITLMVPAPSIQKSGASIYP